MERVHDITENYQLISNSQDIDYILENIGCDEKGEYGCLFVLVGEGEYESIYGCDSNIPYNDDLIYKLL